MLACPTPAGPFPLAREVASMNDVERILSKCLRRAEQEYLEAKARGMEDPVICLWVGSHPDHSEKVGMVVRSRADRVGALEGECRAAAEALRSGPRPGKPLTLEVFTPGGVHVLDRSLPD
jgi:hypothetical protein